MLIILMVYTIWLSYMKQFDLETEESLSLAMKREKLELSNIPVSSSHSTSYRHEQPE